MVDFPLLPVIPIIVAGHNLKKMFISVSMSTRLFRAICINFEFFGTAGLTITMSAFIKSSSACPPSLY